MTISTDPTVQRDPLDWRVPQTFEPATSYQVRDKVLDYVRRDLLGPWDGECEEWASDTHPNMPRDPGDRYLIGKLGPKKADTGADDGSEDLDFGSTVSQDPEVVDALNPRTLGKLWVSSMGCSFQLADDDSAPRRVSVLVEAGRYASGEVRTSEKGGRIQPMTREPLHWQVELDLSRGDHRIGLEPPSQIVGAEHGCRVVEPADPDGITLSCQVRSHQGRRVVRLMLINDQPEDVSPKYRTWLFQSRLVVSALDGATAVFVPSGDAEHPHGDREEAHLQLLYRHTPAYASGHNVAVAVERRDVEPNAWRIATTWLPVTDVPSVIAAPVPGLTTSMANLAELARGADPTPLLSALQPLVSTYAAWVAERSAEADAMADPWGPVARQAVRPAGRVVSRLEESLALLASSGQARQAFGFANAVMERQRHHTVAAGLRERHPELGFRAALAQVQDGDEARKNASWFPFQLAFVLLNLTALADPDSPERTDDVDLLYFPTGGGKTEAYLGLAAFCFALRRLQGVVGFGAQARDGSAGVAVLMRYTLRLLTAQQFQRAAALVCAAEVLRQQDPQIWGHERFSIGLWVGQSVSPNWYGDAATSIANARESGRRGAKIPVLQTTGCPWCGELLRGERDLHADDVARKIRLYCPRGEGDDPCPFSRRVNPDGLPILTVDEEVYREPPSLLIATVDKLAQLPWYGFAGMLFGRVSARCPRHGYRHPDLDLRIGCGVRHTAAANHPAVASVPVTRLRPPDLVISDELHLISGALGSTVGLFESAVDELTAWETPSGRRTTPKIVASTATTKRAAEQVRQLFARDLTIFPPQLLHARKTFFATEQPVSEATPGRRYVGLCAHGIRLKAAEIRLAEILLLAGQTVLDRYGGPADPYATIVGYFSATRELAGMRRYLDDQVLTRVRRWPWRPGMSARAVRDLHITELTSRISSAYITDALHQLAVPFDPETTTTARARAISDAIREAKGRRPEDLHGERPTDVALATSMLQVGVDIGRLGLMVVTGQPKNVAEYIQASSRVGRESDKPGLVITLANWTRPRDLAYFENFEHSHAAMYSRVEALSVTPYARRCLDRGTAGVVVAAIRNSSDDRSLDVRAEDVDLTSPEVAAIVERMVVRANRAGGAQGRDYLVEKIAAFLDAWREQQDYPAAPLAYKALRRKSQQYAGLMLPTGEGRWNLRTVARSMRETENDISLLLPPGPHIYDQSFGAPAWGPRSPAETDRALVDGEKAGT